MGSRARLHSYGCAGHDASILPEQLQEKYSHDDGAARTHRQPEGCVAQERRDIEDAALLCSQAPASCAAKYGN